MDTSLVVAGLALPLVVSLLGWAWQLGFMQARVVRSEKDVVEIKSRQEQVERDLRVDIREGFATMHAKLDDLPCRNPRWNKDNC